MPKARNIIDSLRGAAVWLLVVCVFFGPAGLGASAAIAAASKTCGVSCPCDEAGDESHTDVPAKDADDPCRGESEHDIGDPCNDECPDDCPNCGCCLGAAMPVILAPAASNALHAVFTSTTATVGSPTSGACSSVFRPPRSLT